jgi:uncharacterized protein
LRFIYLHGFASGPSSRKAQIFKARLEAAGAEVEVPALDGGDFENLTISGQYAIVERLAGGGAVSLIGSSMGGYLASQYASRHPEVEKLVLMAPAFHFHARWPKMIGEENFANWRRTGFLEVFHYASQSNRRVSWRLAEDAAQWPPEPSFSQPALIFHGDNDDVVPVSLSEAFMLSHSNVALHRFAAGHELTEVVDDMWSLTAEFFGIAGE